MPGTPKASSKGAVRGVTKAVVLGMQGQINSLQAEQIATNRELVALRRNHDLVVREVTLEIRNLRRIQKHLQGQLSAQKGELDAQRKAQARLLRRVQDDESLLTIPDTESISSSQSSGGKRLRLKRQGAFYDQDINNLPWDEINDVHGPNAEKKTQGHRSGSHSTSSHGADENDAGLAHATPLTRKRSWRDIDDAGSDSTVVFRPRRGTSLHDIGAPTEDSPVSRKRRRLSESSRSKAATPRTPPPKFPRTAPLTRSPAFISSFFFGMRQST